MLGIPSDNTDYTSRPPWTPGFQPPSKCPTCRRVNSLVFTGKRTQTGDHVYKCQVCNNLVGSPTYYAQCDLFLNTIEKDVFYTPCVNCPNRHDTPTASVCVHWRGFQWTDSPVADAIQDTIRRFKLADPV